MCLAWPACLRPVGHFLRTHKEMLAQDAIVSLAIAADAHETNSCLSQVRCSETLNPLLGQFPSRERVWGFSAAGMAAAVATNAFARRKVSGHLMWLPAAAISLEEARLAAHNAAMRKIQ